MTSFRAATGVALLGSLVFLHSSSRGQTISAQPNSPAQINASTVFKMPSSHSPLGAYLPSKSSEPQLKNSPRLNQLIKDGKLYLSLQDAIHLALENNLDIAIARYNLPIADMDILRTKAGGVFRGVNAGVVQGTPGGGVGGFGTGAPGAGAGGTTAGAGGAGAGASGLVQSTLGVGAPVSSYDPTITGSIGAEHQTSPLANQQITECRCYSSILAKPTSAFHKPSPPEAAWPSSSTTIARPQTVHSSTFLRPWARCTGFHFSSSYWLVLAWVRICAI